MSETGVKKRGRPKKVDKILSEQVEVQPESANPKGAASSRTFSTIDTVEKTKKTSQYVKQAKLGAIKSPSSVAKSSTSAKTVKSRTKKGDEVSKSTILQDATAFQSIKPVNSAESDVSTPSNVGATIDADGLTQARKLESQVATDEEVSKFSVLDATRSGTSAETGSSPPVAPAASKFEPGRSSFLDSFLLSEEQPPEIPEDAKVSDRAAFNSQTVNVDEIVGGAGISDMSSFSQLPPSKVRIRESSIPLSKPKTFKAHTLPEFPFGLQKQTTSRILPKAVDPLQFRSNAFSAFRANKTSLASSPNISTTQAGTIATSQSPSIPPESGVSTTTPQAASIAQQKISLQTSSSPKPPDTSPTISAKTQSTSPAAPSSRPPPTVPTESSPRRLPSASASKPGPRKPTEMSREELLKNTDFKQLRRRWTGVIVGIPVLLVTSYILWNRASEQEQFEALKREREQALKPERVRGVMPKRVLDEEVVAK